MDSIQTAALSLRDRIAERIRTDFVDLIPADNWKQMVEAEIRWFITEPDRNSWNAPTPMVSPLRTMIRAAIADLFKARLAKELDDPKFQAKWIAEQPAAGDAVTQIIRDCIPEIMVHAHGRAVQDAVAGLRNLLSQR